MLATNMASSEEKLRFAFSIYDQDSSGSDIQRFHFLLWEIFQGSIDVEEMMKIVGNLYEMDGLAQVYNFLKINIVFIK